LANNHSPVNQLPFIGKLILGSFVGEQPFTCKSITVHKARDRPGAFVGETTVGYRIGEEIVQSDRFENFGVNGDCFGVRF
jgi:hypothetical protein